MTHVLFIKKKLFNIFKKYNNIIFKKIKYKKYIFFVVFEMALGVVRPPPRAKQIFFKKLIWPLGVVNPPPRAMGVASATSN
jgi:hypothetical protein